MLSANRTQLDTARLHPSRWSCALRGGAAESFGDVGPYSRTGPGSIP